MECRAKGFVVRDYALDFPMANESDLDLYCSGVVDVPRRLLNEEGDWGAPLRQGAVVFDEEVYDQILERCTRECWSNAFADRRAQNISDARTGLASDTALAESLATLMPYHVMNWILTPSVVHSRLHTIVGGGHVVGGG